jgi:hypothetical protein
MTTLADDVMNIMLVNLYNTAPVDVLEDVIIERRAQWLSFLYAGTSREELIHTMTTLQDTHRISNCRLARNFARDVFWMRKHEEDIDELVADNQRELRGASKRRTTKQQKK